MTQHLFTPEMIGCDSNVVEGYLGDPFRGEDGHFIGDDGFVVPASFAEYLERYPRHIAYWVGRKLHKSPTDPEVEDVAQDLNLHLCRVPGGRRRRAEDGTLSYVQGKYLAAGFSDIIQTFNPWQQHGASAQRFFNFLHICLYNKLLSLKKLHGSDALKHLTKFVSAASCCISPSNPSDTAGEPANEPDLELVIAECDRVASRLQDPITTQMNTIFIDQFRQYVDRADPSLSSLVAALMYQDGLQDICQDLGVSRDVVSSGKRKLVKLGARFTREYAKSR